MRPVLAIVLLTAALGAAGCARDGDQGTAQAVAERFFSALDSGDGDRACAQLSPGIRTELETQEGSSCREAVTGLGLEGAAVERTDVYVLVPFVELSNGDSGVPGAGQGGLAHLRGRLQAAPASRPTAPTTARSRTDASDLRRLPGDHRRRSERTGSSLGLMQH